MNLLQSPTMHVARWEFRRYFKPRQQLVGMLLMIAVGYPMLLLGPLSRRGTEPVRIMVAGADVLPLAAHLPDRFELLPVAAVGAEIVRQVRAGDIDGALEIASRDDARLHVRRQAEWIAQVRGALAAARQQLMLETSGITAEQLGTITAAPRIEVLRHDAGAGGATRTERIFFVLAIVIMLLAVFTGLGYIFASITGEKQVRVTEQVLAAIPAQQWIDGKILGIAALSVVTVFGTLLSGLVLLAIVRAKGVAVPLPDSFGDPVVLATTALFTILGLFLWLAFLAAVAAMIDDPHTSTRGSLLMLPVFATMAAFLAIRMADSPLVQALSFFPATSPAMMPARLIVGDVRAWEVALSFIVLATTCVLLRTAAGRVFRIAMLMYGKEPSWAEVRRWVFPASVILAVVAVPASAQTSASGAPRSAFPADSVIQALIDARVSDGRAAGIVLGIIDSDGSQRVFTAGTAGAGRTLDRRSIFEIGSITKVFTGTVLADMVHRGEVSLDDPVSEYLPTHVTVPALDGKQITVGQLSSQNSGLPRLPTNLRVRSMLNPYADYTVDQLYEFLGGYTLSREPGAQFEYSNLGVGLLGHALALRAGISFEALVRERILEPLGMTETVITLTPALLPRVAAGHNALGDTVPLWDLPTLAGAGALRSSVDDMLKFAAAALSGSGSVRESIRLAMQPRAPAGAPNNCIGVAGIRLAAAGDTIVWHNGGTGGFRSFIGLTPASGRAVMLLTNSGGAGSDDLGMHLLNPALPLVPSPRR